MTETLHTSLAETAAALAGKGLFGALGGNLAEQVLAKATETWLGAADVLFHQGDEGASAYVVLEGELEVLVDIGLGSVQMAVLGRHQLVGEIAVFGDLPRTATVVARGAVQLLRLDRDDVLAIIADNPDAGRAIIGDLGRRLTMVNQPLAFLSIAAQALQKGEFDPEMIAGMAAQAKDLGPFAKTFQDMIFEIQAKQIRTQEMAMAARIQESVLPHSLPETEPRLFDIEAFMRPTREVGGDLYDFFMIDEKTLAFAVADVSGKGVPASLFMVMLRTVIKAVATPGMSPQQVLTRANTILGEDNDACMFVTVFFGMLNIETGRLVYTNAGHNPPYLLSADGQRRELGANGIAVGIVEEPNYTAETVDLVPGDLLFVFTDGITEAFSPAHEQFGEPRLEALLDAMRGSSTEVLVATVVAAVDAFALGREQFDDITCLALAYRPG